MDSFKCRKCGDMFTDADLRDFREMGETYYKDKTAFVCPDCYDAFSRLTPEKQIKNLLDDATQGEKRDTYSDTYYEWPRISFKKNTGLTDYFGVWTPPGNGHIGAIL